MSTTMNRQLAVTFLASTLAIGTAQHTWAQIAPPAPPAPPAPLAPFALEAPPAPPAPLAVEAPPAPPAPFALWPLGDHDFDFNDHDFDFQIDFDLDALHLAIPPLPPMPPHPPMAYAVAAPEAPGQNVRVVQRRQPEVRLTSRTERLYDEALQLIDRGQFERAIGQFDRLIVQFENQNNAAAVANKVDGALYWKAYSQIKQKQLADALGTLDVMLKKFGDASRWIKDAKALEVEVRQASGQSVSPELQADEELKLLALRGLMQSDPERGVPMIEKLLGGNSSVQVKQNALFVLSQSRTARAREIITGVAKGGNPDLQLRAVRYLGAIGGTENRQILEEVYRSTTDIAVKRAVIRNFVPAGDRARLLEIARTEKSPELRGEAIQQLGAMRATTELSELYNSEPSIDLKRRIIQSLMVSQATDRLIEIAKSERDAQLRRSAVRNLGVMNASKTGDVLRGLYGSERDADVKREIINAIANQRNSTALVELARNEKDAVMKREIVSRLSTMRGDKAAMDYLLELLK
jgi:HEAT repeat protein